MHVEPLSPDDLLARLRETCLMGHGGARVYRHATLEIQTFDPLELTPAQRYVLMPGVRRILELREALDVDIFALEGGVFLDGTPLLPPVVERSEEPDGRTVWLINDGIHRVYAAHLAGSPINVVTVDGASHPYYALAASWEDVVELEELPETFEKKRYRVPGNYKALFRDFNAVFPGVQRERKKSNPAHLTAHAESR
jgi:hypothetical protein